MYNDKDVDLKAEYVQPEPNAQEDAARLKSLVEKAWVKKQKDFLI